MWKAKAIASYLPLAAERLGGLLEDPTLLEKLGEARAVCEAARLLTYRVIDLRAKGQPPSADTNVARVAGTWCERAVADLALAIFGTEALATGHFAESHFRMAMTAGVAVGTTEINLNLVASRFLRPAQTAGGHHFHGRGDLLRGLHAGDPGF